MKFSWFMLIDIGLYFLYTMLKPKDVPEEPPKKLEIPDTQIGLPIGVLFGKRPIKAPVLVDYGDVEIVKVPVDPRTKK